MMRTKTGVNERDLLRLWIVHGELPAARFERKGDCRRVARTFFAERWILARADSGGNPDSPLRIEHRVVHVGLAVPDRFVSPIGGRFHRLVVCARWRLRIANWHTNLARYGAHRVEDRQIVNAE